MKAGFNGKKGEWCLLIAMGLVASVAESVTTYPDMPYAGPSSVPDLPAVFTDYNPPVDSDPVNTNTPAVAEWTRSNRPGDTMALTGETLSIHSGVAEGRDTKFVFYGGEASPADGLIQHLDSAQCALTLPSTLLAHEMYLMWPRNENGYGKPVTINQTEAWWVGPTRVSAGRAFSVYGRNLKLGGGDCHLYIEELDLWLTSVSANPYKADFVLPSDIDAGTYTAWAHNGHGRGYGWADSLPLTVAKLFSYDGSTINVKDYGAVGDGVSDDFAAIDSAFSAAGSGDTIYFPAGTYLVSSTLYSLGNNKRVVGDGADVTIVSPHPAFSGPDGSHAAIISENGGQNLQFENIALESGAHASSSGICFSFRWGKNLLFRNVGFSQLDYPNNQMSYSGPPLVSIENASSVVFSNCAFILDGDLTASSTDDVLIQDSSFKGIHDCNQMVTINDAVRFSIEGCVAQPYDIADTNLWSKGRFVCANGNRGYVRNIYYGDNTTTNMTPRADDGVDQNSGENLLFEGLATRYRGTPVAVASNTIRFADLFDDLTGCLLAVIDGRGVAQNRAVIAFDFETKTVTLDKPWGVEPDTDSTIVIGWYMSQVAVYGNQFGGTLHGVTTWDDIGNAGVEAYGGCFDLCVESNKFERIRSAVEVWAQAENLNGTYTLQPNYFNLYQNNSMENCRYGIENRVAFWSEGPYHADIGLRGNVYRGNRISNMEKWATSLVTWKSYQSMDLTIYDHNTILDTPVVANYFDEDFWNGVASPVSNQLYIGNSVSGCTSGIMMPEESLFVLRGNAWAGATHSGSLPGELLQVPSRVVRLNAGETKSLEVWNGGTAPLSWSASTTSDWVNITQPTGTVSGENSVGALMFQVDASKVPAEEKEAVIAIASDSGEEQQITVEFSAVSLPPPPDPPPSPVLMGISVSGPASMDEKTTAQYVCT
ncbi:MAG: glycosyl hydrolase family 28-related protein, partial [Planctomycetota bacterium]